MDKLRILLVDDDPGYCYDPVLADVFLKGQYKKYFDLAWIQSAPEGRWLLDAFEILAAKYPRDLPEFGLPPDLLMFDYALTTGVYKRKPYQASNICTRIGKRFKELAIGFEEPPTDPTTAPSTGTPKGKDRNGCYLGGELARAFGAHPCGAVPTTAHVRTGGTDAAFYEWLNSGYFNKLFAVKERTAPTLDALISTGVHAFRERLAVLLQSGIVRLSIDELQRLSAQPIHMMDHGIRLSSRFETRTLPVRAVFADFLLRSDVNETEFSKAAKEFASYALRRIFSGNGLNQFNEARQLADRYFQAWNSEEAYSRQKMSGLIAKAARSLDEDASLRTLCTEFNIDVARAISSPRDFEIKPTSEIHVYRPIYAATQDPSVQRLAVLMIAVLVEQHFAGASSPEAVEFRRVLTREELRSGEVAIDHLKGRLAITDQQLRKLISDLRLTESQGCVKIRPVSVAAPSDVFPALDPLPEKVLIYSDREGEWATTYTNAMKRLGKGSNWGSLTLNLSDVLENRPFNCTICQEALRSEKIDPEHPKEGASDRHHGVRPGEGDVLRAFADECEFPEELWPQWLAQAP